MRFIYRDCFFYYTSNIIRLRTSVNIFFYILFINITVNDVFYLINFNHFVQFHFNCLNKYNLFFDKNPKKKMFSHFQIYSDDKHFLQYGY